MAAGLSREEFLLMQKYISDQCGIWIPEDKAYLIESRLAKLLVETGSKTFLNFYLLLSQHGNNKVITRQMIDAITTKETQWFRDKSPWRILEEVLLPIYIREIREGIRSRVRIWSAACATGQEPYSTAICIDRYLTRQGIADVKLSHFEILATDISCAALETARIGRYDRTSITRGIDENCRAQYFQPEGKVWQIAERIQRSVEFRHFNLKESFLSLKDFDIVFCRYVTIYFLEEFKKEILRKIAQVLTPQGVLFLGNSEILADYPAKFRQEDYNGEVYYQLGGQG